MLRKKIELPYPPTVHWMLRYANRLCDLNFCNIQYKLCRFVSDKEGAAYYMRLINELSTLKLFDV